MCYAPLENFILEDGGDWVGGGRGVSSQGRIFSGEIGRKGSKCDRIEFSSPSRLEEELEFTQPISKQARAFNGQG
jgi:hypothetical protein